MVRGSRLAVPIVGACALVATVFNGALASRPAPFQNDAHTAAKTTTINGNLRVTNVIRSDKNMSVYGRLYAHGGEQVWSGLLVRSGGVKSDSLDVTGPIAAQSATITNNLQTGTLQAGTINTATLAATGAGTFGSTLTAGGKLTANGVDAGAGGVTTTGNITAPLISATSQLTAGSIATNGALTAATGTFNNVTVSGNINLSNASVTGLSLSNLTGGNVPSLTIGNTSSTAAPLSLSANGKTAAVGVDTNGNLTFGSVLTSGNLGVGGSANIAGTLTVAGASGITATSLTAPPSSSNVTTPGTLTLNGSAINLAGAASVSNGLTLANGSDVIATVPSGSTANATHVLVAGDRDLAGIAPLTVGGSAGTNTEQTVIVTFIQPYSSVPAVTITPLDDPNPTGPAASKQWVELTQATNGQYTGFVIHHIATNGATSAGYVVRYAYHVMGT